MTDQFDDETNDTPEKKSNEFAKMLEASFKTSNKKLSLGDKIRGEILVIGKEEAYASTGTMYDGVISRKELLDADGNLTVKVGDRIDLYVTSVRGSDIHLSPKKTSKNLAEDLEDAFDMMLPVEGRVTEICKGGFRVAIFGKSAFCPISHMDIKRIEDQEPYVGKKFEFQITKFEESGRNLVVSRRKILEEQRDLAAAGFGDEHKVGDILEGTVTRLEKFGAFVEVAPGIEGLAHISELSWSRISQPHEAVSIGQVVRAKLLKIATEDGRLKLSLSLKDEEANPWSLMAQKFPVGKIVTGKVERREPYGVFVRLEEGVTGLLPKSKTTDHPEFPYDKLHTGDEVTVQIAEVRETERRISLDVPADPNRDDWKGYTSKSTGSFGTFGDQFKNILDKKKGK